MGKKNECYLCGEKLHQGYCRACGLDNTKIKRRNYKLNESESVTKQNPNIKEPISQDALQKAAKSVQSLRSFQQIERTNMVSKQKKRATTKRSFAGGNNFIKLIVILCILMTVLSVIFSITESVVERISYHTSYSEILEKAEPEEYDPYGYVTRELSADGDVLSQNLGAGEYRVGTHIPEGNYMITLVDGEGYFSLTDYENAVYMWKSFGEDEEYDEVMQVLDVRMYQNASFSVSEGVVLEFLTECAQTEAMVYAENPLTEIISVGEDESMVAGVDFPAGIYDISCGEDSVWVDYWIPAKKDWYEEGYAESCLWLDKNYGSASYCNLTLPEGTKIRAEDGILIMTPSEKIYSEDYGTYYDYYEYDLSL